MEGAAPYLFPLGSRLGEDNLVLHASARQHSVKAFAGPLSVKTVRRGRVSWIVAGRDLVVDPSSFLVLAAGERYSMNIDEPKPVETCCAFFAPGFLEQIALDLTSGVESALDDPARIAPPLAYLSALHGDRERNLTDRVATLAKRCEANLKPSGTEEDFLMLGSELLDYYQEIRTQVARVPALKQSTRQELFRRLLIGRDYLHSHSSESISLLKVARLACLSPYHFHRGFTRAFQQTPHTYLTGLRLTQARHLLQTGASVLDTCIAVGFSSPSAFSRLFRTRFSESPSSLRPKFARSGRNISADSGRMMPC